MQRATIIPDLSERMDHLPVTLLHCFAIGICAIGFTFDMLEIALGSTLSAVFSTRQSAAAPLQLSLLLASVYVGATIGSPLLGWLADRYGRRITLAGILLLLAGASLAGAFSAGLSELTLWRCVAGLALGGYPPLMIAYLTDLLPAGRRGMLILVTVAIGTLGPAAGLFLVRSLVTLQPFGLEAWRWGFIAGGVGAGLVALLFRALPESPRWLHSRGRTQEAELACQRFEQSARVLSAVAPITPAAGVDATARTGRGRWTLLALLFFLSAWSTVAFPLLTGAILSHMGFKLSDTLLYVGLSSFGPLIGNIMAALWIDRIGRRFAMIVCAAAMVLSGYVFVLSTTAVWLVCSSFGFMLFVSLFISVLNLYGAELFPTRQRATSIASAWAFNRIGAVMAPMVLLPLLTSAGPFAMFSVIGAALAASALLLAIAPPGRQRRAVA